MFHLCVFICMELKKNCDSINLILKQLRHFIDGVISDAPNLFQFRIKSRLFSYKIRKFQFCNFEMFLKLKNKSGPFCSKYFFNKPFSTCFLPINYLVSTMYVTFQQLFIYSTTMYNRYLTMFYNE